MKKANLLQDRDAKLKGPDKGQPVAIMKAFLLASLWLFDYYGYEKKRYSGMYIDFDAVRRCCVQLCPCFL